MADVQAHLDDLLTGTDALAPIRDALLNALTALIFELEFRGEYAIAQADLLRATAQYITSIGGDDRMVPQAPGEDTEDYRARLLATPLTVTEEAITVGVNIILSSFTTTQCQLIDTVLDRWFIGIGDAAQGWHSFVGAPPEYPDRLYSGQGAINGGFERPNSNPGGARVYDNELGRYFTLLLPDLANLAPPDGILATPDGSPMSHTYAGFYVGDTTDANVVAIVNPSFAIPLSVYQSIEGFVNSVIGQSIRWGFVADLPAAA